MSKYISVVPNICEGRDKRFIDQLTAKLTAVPGLVLLDVSMDATRNRTVINFTGTHAALLRGGMILYEDAIKHIDMRQHKGEYPRIGAVDVFPFVPLKDVSIEESVEVAVEFAEKVAQRFSIPVYLYGEAARFPLRRDLEKIREVQFEGLEERLKDPRWKPDFGPEEFKNHFGATAIGARYPLVSFKVLLNTPEIEIARSICQAVQYCYGGLRHVSANSGLVYNTQLTHVTVSIHNYKVTPMYKVIEMIRMEGRRYNIGIVEVEMIGLIPEVVFLDSAMYYMNISHFANERILEKNIQEHLDESLG